MSHRSGDAPPRLPHGYTNATFTERSASSGEPTVVKRYLGPDREERQRREVWALPALFDGYGIHPPWSLRHSAKLTKCAGLLAFARRWSAESAGVWQRRIEATEAFAE